MALVNFKRGLQANLPIIGEDGVFYVTTDSHHFYIGLGDNSAPILLNQIIQIVEDISLLPTDALVDDIVYCKEENILAIYTGETNGWVQINPDTGVIDIEVRGEGNAVSALTYDTSSRKLIYTLGQFVTPEELDSYKSIVDNNITELAQSIAAQPKPMNYKGTVSSEIELISKETVVQAGDIYQVIVSDEYEGHWAEIGDLFIWDGNKWVYIPTNIGSQTNNNLTITSETLKIEKEDTNSISINLEWGSF